MKDYHVLIASDGTGETAHVILKAAMVQFKEDIVITRYSNVREESQIKSILEAAAIHPTLVVYTFVSIDLRGALVYHAERVGMEHIDMLGPLMDKLASFFHKAPTAQPGLLHKVDEQYYQRIDAIEYAIRHDDGRGLDEVESADLVLVGISRTSKTPLSIYLAQEGWMVANVPLVSDLRPPRKLFEVDQHKIAGLTIDAERLAEIRRERLRRLGVSDSSYADLHRIKDELGYAHSVFEENPTWPVIDVTGKSLEEVSQEVLDQLVGRGRRL